jgi:hypothetical protein
MPIADMPRRTPLEFPEDDDSPGLAYVVFCLDAVGLSDRINNGSRKTGTIGARLRWARRESVTMLHSDVQP